MGILDFFAFPRSGGTGSGLLGNGPVMTQGGQPLPVDQQPNFWTALERNSDSLMGLGLGLMSGAQDPRNGIRNALQGFQSGEQSDRQRMLLDQQKVEKDRKMAAAAEYAKQNPQFASLLAANPDLAVKMAEKQFETQLDPTQKQLRQAQIDYYRAKSEKTADETMGLQPIYGQDAQGNPIGFQIGNKGTVKPLSLPEGAKLANGIEKIDAGTYWVLRDKRTGQSIGTEPKNVSEAASQKEQGQAEGTAIAAAPAAIANGERALGYIDEVRKSPGKWIGTGLTSYGNILPGSPGRAFQGRVDQLKGGAFLEAFNTLKGGGAITEAEGQKATQALARLDTAQSEKDFDTALKDFEGVVRAGVARARSRVGSGGATPAASPAPASAAPSGGRVRFDANGNRM